MGQSSSNGASSHDRESEVLGKPRVRAADAKGTERRVQLRKLQGSSPASRYFFAVLRDSPVPANSPASGIFRSVEQACAGRGLAILRWSQSVTLLELAGEVRLRGEAAVQCDVAD